MATEANSVEPALAASSLESFARKLVTSEFGAADRLLPRWIFLRALGLIYFSAFYSLVVQIRGLIGPHGVLPAGKYLELIAGAFPGIQRFWYAPSLLWISAGSPMLLALCWAGMIASLLLVVNLWPRLTLAVCFVCFLSFVGAASGFADFQSDGMLLEAGLISLFFAPSGVWPGLGSASPPSRFSLFLLQWEWFRIYFQSGLVKLLSGDEQWRNLTAMDEYYQNCPLPTWVGWYVQQLPHWFHAATVVATLAMELALVWMIVLPRRARTVLFFIVTFWQVGVILTANYAFLNYLVLALGILVVDDRFVWKWLPRRWRPAFDNPPHEAAPGRQLQPPIFWRSLQLALSAVVLTWLFYASSARFVSLLLPLIPLPRAPVKALEPFRVADSYGLFAVMTRGLYQIEFQGSDDGTTWVAYPFRNKPQALNEAPRIYAPYQPRFDWDLWFASLGVWTENPIVANTEDALLRNDRDVLELFAGNPFARAAPRQVRVVLWQYWFTSMSERRSTGHWWRREFLGLYAPVLQLQPDGSAAIVQLPEAGGERR
jgi:lipase maturation factor